MKTLLALVLSLVSLCAGAQEFFIYGGTAHWGKCGNKGQAYDGCWEQQGVGIPAKWQLGTHATIAGFRVRDAYEFAYHDLGSVSVSGTFVADASYDSSAHVLHHPEAQRVDAYTQQHTTGVSASYAPRWAYGSFSVTPSAGLIWVAQSQSFSNTINGKSTTGNEANVHRVTPVLGLRLQGHPDKNWAIGAGVNWYAHPSYVNSLGGRVFVRYVGLSYAL